MKFDLSNLEDIRILSFQIIILLFIAVAIYLYVNLRSNSKRIGKRRLILKKLAKEEAGHSIKYDSQCQFYHAIPIPICRINLMGEIEVFNKLFMQLLSLSASNIKSEIIGELFEGHLGELFQMLCEKEHVFAWNKDEEWVKEGVVYRVDVKYLEQSDYDSAYMLISFRPQIKTEPNDVELQVDTIIKKLIKESLVAILLLNDDGKILEDNQTACTLYGNKIAGVNGTNIEEILPVEFQDGIRSDYKELFLSNQLKFKGALSNYKGRLIPVSVSIVRFKVNCRLIILFFIEDVSLLVVSENKLLEAQKKVEQSDLLKASFLSNMSHEIRTPLNVILGFSELLNDPSIGEKDRSGFIRQIKQSGESLLELITGIISFSRISSGVVSIINKQVDLNDIFVRLQSFAVKMNKSKSSPVDIRINMSIGDVAYNIYSDEEKVFQLLKNLIGNAIKFTYSGSVEFGCKERGKRYLEFFVKDTGIGIPKDKLKTIFERFVQANDSSNREFGGTGIGLTISAELVRLLGGYLWIESTVDIGSCFNVVLPKDISLMEQTNNFKCFSGDCRDKSILVIDELEESYTNLIIIATSKQQQSFWAQDIGEAKSIIFSNQIDLILVNGNCQFEGEACEQFFCNLQLNIQVLSFNKRLSCLSRSNYLESYPFTEKGIIMLYKKYL